VPVDAFTKSIRSEVAEGNGVLGVDLEIHHGLQVTLCLRYEVTNSFALRDGRQMRAAFRIVEL
jgi:hypothetical protein